MAERQGSGLYDRLMATGVVIKSVQNREELRRETTKLEAQLDRAQVFNIQNVADYYHSFPMEAKTWSETDFPKVAPPFRDYFMEFKPRLNWNQGTVMGNAVGMLSHAYDLDNGDIPPAEYPTFPNARWVIENTLFMEDRQWEIAAWTRLVSAVKPNGDLAQINEGGNNIYGRLLPAHLNNDPTANDQKMMDVVGSDIYLAYYPNMLALSFLHCKNVVVMDEQPRPKLSRAFERRHGRPLISFHTLNIEPMKTVLKTEGQSDTVGLRKALHIVRGHFGDYTDKGLFGRHRGIFWFDQHARGSAEQGIVLKDYNVDTPKQ